jgi:hypothetical protein
VRERSGEVRGGEVQELRRAEGGREACVQRLRKKKKIKRWGAGGCHTVRGEKIRLLGFLFLCCLSPQISKLPPLLLFELWTSIYR